MSEFNRNSEAPSLTRKETLHLIYLRAKLHTLFSVKKHAGDLIWRLILQQVGVSHKVTVSQAKKKWDTMCRKYRELRKSSTFGQDPQPWAYYDYMKRILKGSELQSYVISGTKTAYPAQEEGITWSRSFSTSSIPDARFLSTNAFVTEIECDPSAASNVTSPHSAICIYGISTVPSMTWTSCDTSSGVVEVNGDVTEIDIQASKTKVKKAKYNEQKCPKQVSSKTNISDKRLRRAIPSNHTSFNPMPIPSFMTDMYDLKGNESIYTQNSLNINSQVYQAFHYRVYQGNANKNIDSNQYTSESTYSTQSPSHSITYPGHGTSDIGYATVPSEDESLSQPHTIQIRGVSTDLNNSGNAYVNLPEVSVAYEMDSNSKRKVLPHRTDTISRYMQGGQTISSYRHHMNQHDNDDESTHGLPFNQKKKPNVNFREVNTESGSLKCSSTSSMPTGNKSQMKDARSSDSVCSGESSGTASNDENPGAQNGSGKSNKQNREPGRSLNHAELNSKYTGPSGCNYTSRNGNNSKTYSFVQLPNGESHVIPFIGSSMLNGDLCIVGKPAPSWEGTAVVNGDFKEIKLSNYKGKYLVFFFYPLDFTFVCPTEILAFNDRLKEFQEINTEVVACSVDSHFTHLAWTNTPRREGGLGTLDIPLLSDLNHKISKDYGVYLEDVGHTLRGLFIIDAKGILRQITMNDLNVGRSVDETLRLVQAFQFTEKHGEVCPAGWKPGADTIVPDPEGSKKYFGKHEF